MSDLCGVLNLNKPVGVTSRDVVNLISRPLRKVKVGHAGTLDPLASGVLIVCVGPATRLIEYVQRMPKTYLARVRLGATSATDDADGPIQATPGAAALDELAVIAAVASQVGTVEQVPPGFSAIKVAGERAYALSRAGRDVVLKARPVSITRIEILAYDWPTLDLEVDCGSGTYIRSIARDVGALLGVGGYIETLERTRIGHFTLADALDPATLDRESILARLRPPGEALAALPEIRLTDDETRDVLQGRSIAATSPAPPGESAAIDPAGRLVCILESVDEGRRLAPHRVLASP